MNSPTIYYEIVFKFKLTPGTWNIIPSMFRIGTMIKFRFEWLFFEIILFKWNEEVLFFNETKKDN